MKAEKIKKFIGKNVEVKLVGKEVYKGTLINGNDNEFLNKTGFTLNGYLIPLKSDEYIFFNNHTVKKIKEIKQ